jgi:hypothetical protein
VENTAFNRNTKKECMLPKLTEQQNRFVLVYGANGFKPVEAYMEAYDCSNMSKDSIYVEASRLLKHPKVAQWIEYIHENAQQVARDELNYSIRDCFNELDELKVLSKKDKSTYSVAKGCIELKGKLAGHFNRDEKESTISGAITVMGDVVVDGTQLDFEVGEEVEQNADKTSTNP